MAEETSYLDRLGDIFANGLERTSDMYVSAEGRFRVVDPAQQYTVLPNGQLINNNRQQPVGTPAAPMNITPVMMIGGAVLLLVLFKVLQ